MGNQNSNLMNDDKILFSYDTQSLANDFYEHVVESNANNDSALAFMSTTYSPLELGFLAFSLDLIIKVSLV